MKKLEPKFDEKVGLLIASDDNYVPYLGTAIYSMIYNCKDTTNLDIIILENEYSETNKRLLKELEGVKKNISIRFVEAELFIKELKVNPSRVSINCFAKDFCTNEYFSLYDRMIVLDSDIVVTGDLQGLFNYNLDDKLIAAVRDYYMPVMIKYKYHTDDRLNNILLEDYFSNIGLDWKNYYNAGVVIFDVKKCLNEKLEESMLEILKDNPTVMYPSQDELLMAVKDRVKELNLEWNFQNPYGLCAHYNDFPNGYLEEVENAKIVHFLGKSKPWNDINCLNSDIFWKYARQTPWIEIMLKRKKEFEKKHFFELRVIPKGSIRRTVFLKTKYMLKQIKSRKKR